MGFQWYIQIIGASQEESNSRKVFKFQLELTKDDSLSTEISKQRVDLDHNRLIPAQVKLEVWKRDRGKCTKCCSTDNLHFDHILPFPRGGSSLVSKNIQLLCARHNIEKSDNIE